MDSMRIEISPQLTLHLGSTSSHAETRDQSIPCHLLYALWICQWQPS